MIIQAILFMVVQAWVINGVHISFKGYRDEKGIHGNIFYTFFAYRWNGEEWWQKPLYSCVKCMASFWGALTFWPFVLYVYGFDWIELPIFTADVFALTFLNWFFYKMT